MYILFLRNILIPLRHLLCHFTFLSKAFFVPFTCVHFSIKIINWSVIYIIFLIHLFCLKHHLFRREGKTKTLVIINHHMMTALVTVVMKHFHHKSPLKHKDFVAFEPLNMWETMIL